MLEYNFVILPVVIGIISIGASQSDSAFSIVDRASWGAEPPGKPAQNLSTLPAPFVIISHTVSKPCFNQRECSDITRKLQKFHMENSKWDDIAYNFLVGGDGKVYEGRGWNVAGAHAANWNKKSIGISFIGNFHTIKPTDQQLFAAKKLLRIGVRQRRLNVGYKLLGHRQVSSTISPGDELYAIIKTWPHWSQQF